jgi:polyhydroxybutyrate depolymerase
MNLIGKLLLMAMFASQAWGQSDPLPPGDHLRALIIGGQKRSYLVHIPARHDPNQPAPIVLALHGAAMNGPMMAVFCGLNVNSDEAGFIAVYPSGTGAGPFLVWNAGGFGGQQAVGRVDDVAFISRVIDEVAKSVQVDTNRVYACGMSNGAMMCYRLAAELSDRIAAIAPVAGTIAIRESKPKRPVPVLHFHGTEDALVPFARSEGKIQSFIRLKGAEESVLAWVALNGCLAEPRLDVLSKAGDELKVTRKTYSGGRNGSEVVLVTIEGGGHTWPGMKPMVSFIGKSATNVSANALIWDFFSRHPMK